MAKKFRELIPIAKPFLGASEVRAAAKVITSGWLSQGHQVEEFEDKFRTYVDSRYACAVSSCTTGLHLALLAVGVKAKDVVITVSHSFIATANSIRYCLAAPLFVDIDLNTFNMSIESLKKCLYSDCRKRGGKLFYKSSRVAAIMLVHQMGLPCNLRDVLALACEFNLPVVEDAACAIGSEVKIKSEWEKIGRPHGDIACFSFHPRKLITTGEGGMLTTNNPGYDKKFRLLRQHGMTISDVSRHRAKRAIFEEYAVLGYNYRMTDIQAAIGLVQIKKIPQMVLGRRKIAAIYYARLKNIPWLRLPQDPVYGKSNWQSYPVRRLENAPLSRDGLIQYLLDNGVSTRRGIMNAHQENVYASGLSLRNSEIARDSVILLPIFNRMKSEQIGRIVGLIKNA